MDPHRFDELTRAFATGTSRRRVLQGLAAAAASGALALLGGRRSGADAAGQFDVCHRAGDPTSPFVLIRVDAAAVPAHAGHGDAVAPDFGTDPAPCGSCDRACAAGEVCAGGDCVPGECASCPGGQGCRDGRCVCTYAGACPDGDPSTCGILPHGSEFACQAGCCCVPTGTPSWDYACGEGGDPHCCSAYCGPEGACACIPDGHVDGVPFCPPGPHPHCCSGWCGPDGRCSPAP